MVALDKTTPTMIRTGLPMDYNGHSPLSNDGWSNSALPSTPTAPMRMRRRVTVSPHASLMSQALTQLSTAADELTLNGYDGYGLYNNNNTSSWLRPPQPSSDDNHPHSDDFVFAKPALPTHRKRTQSMTAIQDQPHTMEISSSNSSGRSGSTPTGSDPVKFHTPITGRVVKPIPQAFHSTGLLLKRNGRRGADSKAMPDTPLKRMQTAHGMWNIEGNKGSTAVNAPGGMVGAPSPTSRLNSSDSRIPLHEQSAKRNTISTSLNLPLPSPLFLPSAASCKQRHNNLRRSSLPHVTDPFGINDNEEGDEADDAEDEEMPRAPQFPARSVPFHEGGIGDTSLLFAPHAQLLRADYFDDNWQQHIFDSNRTDVIHANYFDSTFTILATLGVGTFAEAYKVRSLVDGRLYAVKKSKHTYTGFRDRQQKLNEVMMMWKVSKCSHCIRLEDAWEQNGVLYMQTELCEGGTLQSYMEDNCKTGPLEDTVTWQILTEIALGLKEIHELDVVHLDIKPANIFITEERMLKIADFGMAAVVPVPPSVEREGDRTYLAPEVLEHYYSKPADIFSLGLITLEAATNIILPENGEWWQRLRQGDVMTLFQSVSPPLSDIITSMLAVDPQHRPTVRDILNHPITAMYS
ncbi:hypothetical protein SmJEL517_g01537 [Synchytrium microbalum]|uniref:Protein kinase domain-containing protein n=1 Tax=Synchytrium microbalum TaxID=1806994 RepID=A0A507C468_9FUNG|nr:uncharacterized protein SmJEL517_g01537 [Synchytrium microbalum]TPX36330.1 hypothetical protein SmJEL517_g01537 [Synchytrium microbalum]